MKKTSLIAASVMMMLGIVATAQNNIMIVELANGEKVQYNTADVVQVYFDTNEVVAPQTMEWVDLGLQSGLLWASCNLGTNVPEGLGDYYRWGNTQPVSDTYNGVSYYGYNDSELKNMGVLDNSDNLTPAHDAATVVLGAGCHMFTLADLSELRDNTTWAWETVNNQIGVRFTSKINGNSIFFPAAGWISDDNTGQVHGYDTHAVYWSSIADWGCVWDLFLPIPSEDNYGYNGGNFVNINSFRGDARPVRAVRTK